MKLGELLEGLDVRRIDGDLNVEITGLSYDSRHAGPGHLYFSTARDAKRNRANIDDALNRGARAVVVGGWDGGTARPAATLVVSERPRLLMGAAASRFFSAPSERVDLIGITGTSGKTTTSYILASIFEAAGMPTGIIGTIGIFIRGKKIYSGLTTPESIDFESALGADGARGRASRGGGSVVAGNRGRAGRGAEFSRLHVHQPRPRPSRLSRDGRGLFRGEAAAVHRDTADAASARTRSQLCAATIRSVGACSKR